MRIFGGGIPAKRLLDFFGAERRHNVVSVFTVRGIAKLPVTRVKFGVLGKPFFFGKKILTVMIVFDFGRSRVARVNGKKQITVTVKRS